MILQWGNIILIFIQKSLHSQITGYNFVHVSIFQKNL